MPEIGNKAKHRQLYKQVEMLEMNQQQVFYLFYKGLVHVLKSDML